ncbi:MAG: hypothetical protein AAFQ76_15845 [Cyanobacteria bacterium J06626_26]
MTKKRIADLLKEEVEKTNDPDQTSAKSTSQQPQADTEAVSTSSNEPAANSTNRTRKRTTTNKSGSTTAVKKSATAASSTTGFEKQVAELETALKQAKEQITALQKDIETHQTRIFELKDELTAANKATVDKAEALTKVTQELETAKDTIRKITAAQEEETPPKDETPQKVIHGADLATNRNTLSLRSRPSSYKAIPEYAIQRGEQNSMLSDDDIGWVD